MKTALVLGGTRYFGKRLVQLLLNTNYQVTILTRGLAPNPFGSKVEHLKYDRKDVDAIRQALFKQSFNVIYDQSCYDLENYSELLLLLKEKTEHYILTSSQTVYESGENRIESDFNPLDIKTACSFNNIFSYREIKRQAEAIAFQACGQQSCNKLTVVRFPFVLGLDDFHKRLDFYIQKIRYKEEFPLPDLNQKTCFISAKEAAETLFSCNLLGPLGVVNASSLGAITLGELLHIVETKVGEKALVSVLPGKPLKTYAPFAREATLTLNTQRAQNAGVPLNELMDWLPGLVSEIFYNLVFDLCIFWRDCFIYWIRTSDSWSDGNFSSSSKLFFYLT